MTTELSWPERAPKFAKDRERIKEILIRHGRPLDMAQIYAWFKQSYRYLPQIERRMRELVKNGEVRKNGGAISTYEVVVGGKEEH